MQLSFSFIKFQHARLVFMNVAGLCRANMIHIGILSDFSQPHPLPCPGAIGLGHQIRPSRSGTGCSLARSFPFAQQRYDIRLQPIMRFDALRAF